MGLFDFWRKADKASTPASESLEAGPNYLALGVSFMEGREHDQDSQKARMLFRQGAQQGDTHCQLAYAIFLDFGLGGPKNREEAFKWYQQAAEQGIDRAQYKVADFYRKGDVIEQDLEQAQSWYKKAAEQGYARAKERLADIEKQF